MMRAKKDLKSSALTISKSIAISILLLAVILISSTSPALSLRPEEAGTARVEPASDGRKPASALSDKQRKVRIKHAHELLGRYYKKSSVNVGETIPKINSAVYRWTKDHLPEKYKDQSGRIAQTIIDESLKRKFDPVFLMSVIEGESSWRPEKVGAVGEVGLMQLRPGTGKWMASRAGVKWGGRETLFDPCLNIKIGATYLNFLRDRFDDHARLYLAAYNMGQSNVDSALERKIWPKDYPIHIMKKYIGFYESMKSAALASGTIVSPVAAATSRAPTAAAPAILDSMDATSTEIKPHGRRDRS
jgi:soluble lytic murein transglycosylase-like protein